MYTVEYINQDERQIAIAEAQGNNFVMLHDDFTATGGLLTFDEPIPKSDEELQAEADEARLKEIAAMAHSAMRVPQLAEGFVLLCKKLGYS